MSSDNNSKQPNAKVTLGKVAAAAALGVLGAPIFIPAAIGAVMFSPLIVFFALSTKGGD